MSTGVGLDEPKLLGGGKGEGKGGGKGSALIDYAYSRTVCQSRPELCEPRDIRMVLFDADDTMWHIEPPIIASNIHGPFKLLDPDTVEASEEPYSYSGGTSYTLPKPKKKEKKRSWYRSSSWERSEPTGPTDWKGLPLKEEPEDFFLQQMTPEEGKATIEEIEEELYSSLPEDMAEKFKAAGGPKEPQKSKEEKPIYLEDIRGWKPETLKKVRDMINKYGEKVCRVVDVNHWGDIVVDCKGEMFDITEFGSVFAHHEASTPLPPAKKTAPMKVKVKLLPTFRDTMKRLREMNIPVGIISLNTPGSVKAIVDAFGMKEKFVEIQDTWSAKGTVFDEISKRMKICPCNMMFVDNTLSHVQDVSKKCGLSLQLGKGKDVEKPIEILNYIRPRE